MEKTMNIDNMILGDNQFFGVNHMSEEKGRITAEQFKDVNEIRRIMHTALEFGVTGVFLSTHPAINAITDMMRNDSVIKNNISVYVNVPYILKYVSMVNAQGIPSTIKTMLLGQSKIENIKLCLSSLKNIVTTDFVDLANKLVDIEVKPFKGLNVKAIFLHNILCDLCLGYELTHVIQSFDKHIKKNYHAVPAYGTINLPSFSAFLEKSGIEDALIMTAFNKKGFLMNPGISEYEEIARNPKYTLLAMCTLASGRIPPKEAYEYLARFDIKHFIVGLSNREHAEETFGIIKNIIRK